jgi:hypothetical protein
MDQWKQLSGTSWMPSGAGTPTRKVISGCGRFAATWSSGSWGGLLRGVDRQYEAEDLAYSRFRKAL